MADGVAELLDESHQNSEVVDRCQAVPEDFTRHEEVPKVGAAESLAGETVATLVGRTLVLDEPVVAQIDAATPGQDGPVAGDPGWQHAIEHIDAAGDRLDQISRGSHPHQVAGADAGEARGRHGYPAVAEQLRCAGAAPAAPEPTRRQPAK